MSKEKEQKVEVKVEVVVKTEKPEEKPFDIGPRPHWVTHPSEYTNEGFGAAD